MATGGHPKDRDVYTPVSDQLLDLFDAMIEQHGTWRQVAALSETRLKVLRKVRRVNARSVSRTLLKRLIDATGVGDIDDFDWYTPQEMTEMGIWAKHFFVEGHNRVWR